MPRSIMISVSVLAMTVFAQGAVAAPGTLVVTAMAPLSNSYLTKQSTVRYGDLNVADQHDAAALYARIDAAALRTCGGGSDRIVLHDFARKIEKCRSEAVAEAVAALGAPAVTQAAADARK